jgi:hypothetical protein
MVIVKDGIVLSQTKDVAWNAHSEKEKALREGSSSPKNQKI